MKDNPFQTIVNAYVYNANYRILQEMRADSKMLKAYEEYKKAPLEELQKASAYVAAWQQVRVAEMTKEAYLEAQRQQEQAKADYEKKQSFGIEVETEIKKYTS